MAKFVMTIEDVPDGDGEISIGFEFDPPVGGTADGDLTPAQMSGRSITRMMMARGGVSGEIDDKAELVI